MRKLAATAWALSLLACGDSKKESGYFDDQSIDAGATLAPDASSTMCMIPERSPIEVPDSSDADCRWDLNDPCGPDRYCQTFQDAPVQAEARCVDGDPKSPKTRLLGTVFDFGALVCSGALVPAKGVELRFAPALEAATDADSAWAMPLAKTVSDARGRFDLSVDLTGTGLGVLGLAAGGQYARSANGIVVPALVQPKGCRLCYGDGSDAHDVFALPVSMLADWSDALSKDSAQVRERLPIGKRGGTVGLVRVLETGVPVAGVVIKSAVENGTGHVRYLNEDQASFNTKATTRTGAFVVLGPSLAEGFDAVFKGKKLTRSPNLAGTTPNSVLVMLYNVNQADVK